MKIKICAPRIFGYAAFVGLMFLGSTFLFAHSSQNSDLADDPAVAAQLQSGQGKPVQLDGQIEIVHQDFRDGHGKFVFTLKQSDGTRVPMKFAKHPPTHLLTGDHIRANGRMLNGNLLLYSGGNAKQTGGGSGGGTTTTPSIPVPNTFGAQSTLIILVNFQDDIVQPYTVADAEQMFFGTANNFFSENSYQQASVTGVVAGWYTIPDSVSTCNMSQLATDAQNAATSAGINLASYTRYVYAFPDNSACAWAGSSTVGGNPSQSWINESTPDSQTIHHELGHAFGLWHSHSLDCGTTATICSSGNVVEYGDRLDTMGTPQTASAHYNAFQKERLGWLNYGGSPSIQTVTSSGNYTISPYELGGPGPNALKILKSTDSTTGTKTWYYLEARQAVGFDAFLSDNIYYTQNETSGVLVHLGTDTDGNSSQLLDMTPATPTARGWFDASLVAGQSFQDSIAGITIAPTNVSSTGATVQITMSGSPQAPSATTVSTNQTSYLPGQTVNITVTMLSGTSPDVGAGVTATVTAPNGRGTSLSGTTGSNGVALLSYKLSRRAASGIYQVQVGTNVAAAASVAGASTIFTVQ